MKELWPKSRSRDHHQEHLVTITYSDDRTGGGRYKSTEQACEPREPGLQLGFAISSAGWTGESHFISPSLCFHCCEMGKLYSPVSDKSVSLGAALNETSHTDWMMQFRLKQNGNRPKR